MEMIIFAVPHIYVEMEKKSLQVVFKVHTVSWDKGTFTLNDFSII